MHTMTVQTQNRATAEQRPSSRQTHVSSVTSSGDAALLARYEESAPFASGGII